MNVLQRTKDKIGRVVWKALYDLHPELTERQPLLRLYSDEEEAAGGGFKEGADYYSANVWVRRAVQVLSDNIAPLPLQIVDVEQSSIEAHPLLDLFEYVNNQQDSQDLWQQWMTDMAIGGESGFEFVRNGAGRFKEVWIRQPHHFSVRLETGAKRRYGGIVGYNVDDAQADPYDVPADEFLHFKFYNPLNPWRGLAPITGIRLGILIDEFARAWARMFFKNAARPDVAIVAPQGLTKTEREELERKFEAKYSGIENAHRVVALEQGVTDVKTLSYPPKDIEWLEQRRFSRQEIAAIFGVPDEVIGFGRDTYENFGTALKALWMLTLTPITRSRDARLTEFFRGTGDLKPNERFATDLGDVEVLREDKSAKIEQAKALWGMGVPLNVALEYAEVGIEDIPGGNVGYLPITLVAVTGGTPAPSNGNERRYLPRGIKAWEYESPEHVRMWQRKDARTERYYNQMRRQLAVEFQRQQVEVNRRLRNQQQLGRGKLAKMDIEADEWIKQNITGLFDVYGEVEAWRAEFGPLFAQALLEVGLDEMDNLGLDIAFDLNRPEVQAELGNILGQFAKKVNDTTYSDLAALFSQAEMEGASIPTIMEMLSAYWEGRKSEASRERIARTTMTSLNNAGDEAAWGQTDGIVIGSRWLATLGDDRTRPAHLAAHGQVRGLRQMFDVGGELLAYPGDPQGSPENIIHCRCSRGAVLVGEALE